MSNAPINVEMEICSALQLGEGTPPLPSWVDELDDLFAVEALDLRLTLERLQDLLKSGRMGELSAEKAYELAGKLKKCHSEALKFAAVQQAGQVIMDRLAVLNEDALQLNALFHAMEGELPLG